MSNFSESDVHNTAYSLLLKVLDSQPQLLSSCPPHGAGGVSTGQFINSLYDQLVVLSRKNLSDGSTAG